MSADPMKFAPIRETAAPMFAIAPVMVLDPISFAAPPMDFLTAFWNVARLISPPLAISNTFSDVVPISFARY